MSLFSGKTNLCNFLHYVFILCTLLVLANQVQSGLPDNLEKTQSKTNTVPIKLTYLGDYDTRSKEVQDIWCMYIDHNNFDASGKGVYYRASREKTFKVFDIDNFNNNQNYSIRPFKGNCKWHEHLENRDLRAAIYTYIFTVCQSSEIKEETENRYQEIMRLVPKYEELPECEMVKKEDQAKRLGLTPPTRKDFPNICDCFLEQNTT